MYRHRLYFNPSIAGLNALAISQPKHAGKGLRLTLSALPMEYGLRATGPSFSILASRRAAMLSHISLAFPLQLRTAVQLPGVELQHRFTLTWEMQALDVCHMPPT